MESFKKQLFFSHTWQVDKLGRDTHARVYELAKMMERCGWSIWIDEDNIKGNIDASMATGIDNADAIIVCLTENYCKKVNETARDPRKRDNCLKEWTYANARNKLMIPVVMEPILLSINNWPAGIVSLHFGSTLYIDASTSNLRYPTINLIKQLDQHMLSPNSQTPQSSYLVSSRQKIRSNSLDSDIPLYVGNVQRTIQLCLFLHKKFINNNFQSKTKNIKPKNILGTSRWKSTGQLFKVHI